MKRFWFFLCGTIMIFTPIMNVPANSALLADWSFSNSGGGGPFVGSPPSSADFFIFFDDPITVADPDSKPLSETVSKSSTPTQVVWNSTDAGFSVAVAWLTNGTDDIFGAGYEYLSGSGGTNSQLESGAFASDPGFSNPDLMGSVIETITMDIFLFENYVAEAFPGAGYDLLNTNIAGQIIIEGTPVPIPAAIYLLGAGFIGLAGLRRKIKK